MTWQAGDLALCVNSGFLISPHGSVTAAPELVVGRIYVVREAHYYGLRLVGVPDKAIHPVSGKKWAGFMPERFRKIAPHTPDAEDAETIRLLKGVHA